MPDVSVPYSPAPPPQGPTADTRATWDELYRISARLEHVAELAAATQRRLDAMRNGALDVRD